MKKSTITVNFDEEKTAALKLYLEQKGTSMVSPSIPILQSIRRWYLDVWSMTQAGMAVILIIQSVSMTRRILICMKHYNGQQTMLRSWNKAFCV